MKKSRLSCFRLILLLMALFLCIGVMLAAVGIFYLPIRAAQVFGPSAPGLSPRQRVYLSATLLLNGGDLTRPLDPSAGTQPFQIQLGEPPSSIARRLHNEGFISNAEIFRDYLVYSGLDTTLQAGDFSLSASMTPIQIAAALQDATPAEVTLNILPGWRLEELAATLPTSGLEITPEEFLQAAHSRPAEFDFLEDLPPGASLEGFLFPDSYRLSRQLSAEGLISSLLANFDQQVDMDLRQGFKRQGLTLYQAVTLASIVQREAVVKDEMPLIASVFYNRLSAGLKLDSDPTVQYALGFDASKQTWWTNPLSLADLQFDSPYNTYRYAGLPPGPIDNPGLAALQAVAFPGKTPYYYFRAACDGSGKHVFSETFAEHVQKACP